MLNIYWKDWCRSSINLATWCNEPTYWKRPWCWENLRAGAEGRDREWYGWMASVTLSLDYYLFLLFFSFSVVSNSLQPRGLQYAILPSPSPSPGVGSNSCPLSQWCPPTISSSVVPFSFCLQSFPESGSFPVSQFFVSCGLSIGTSALASVLPMNIQGWFHLGLTGWISLQSKELSGVFSHTTVQKHQFFNTGFLLYFFCTVFSFNALIRSLNNSSVP